MDNEIIPLTERTIVPYPILEWLLVSGLLIQKDSLTTYLYTEKGEQNELLRQSVREWSLLIR